MAFPRSTSIAGLMSGAFLAVAACGCGAGPGHSLFFCGGAQQADASAGPMEAYHHARFHPVPTRPALMPRPWPLGPMETVTGSGRPAGARPASQGEAAPQIELHVPDFPEPAPITPPDVRGNRLTAAPELLDSPSRPQSWIFRWPNVRQTPVPVMAEAPPRDVDSEPAVRR